jgi:hypothetical protein
MKMRVTACSVLVAALSALLALPAAAYWTPDGNAVCTEPGLQENALIVSDGSLGAIIVWQDYRNENDYDIYAQRVNAAGVPQWTSNGVAICIASEDQLRPMILPDGSGGAIIAWWDSRNGNKDIYAQRVNASGVVQWATDGIAICSAALEQSYPTIASDGAGGAIFTWQDYRGGSYFDIYAQRVNPAGVPQWADNGIAICSASHHQIAPAIVSDDVGGAIIAWSDFRGGANWDIYAQRIDASGSPQWTVGGVAICTASEHQWNALIASNGANGAIIAWQDLRDGIWKIYAQGVNASGSVLWASDGVGIAAATVTQLYHQIVSDGSGGAIITWSTQSSESDWDIYAQLVDDSGALRWTASGNAICAVDEAQTYSTLASDGSGGAIITWQDNRSEYMDIYAQRMNAAGAAQWSADGLAICTAALSQAYPTITSDGSDGAIITWWDERSGSSVDIYAQQVDARGRIGDRPPTIHSILDVPGDNGGCVNLAWDATPFDYLSGEVTKYTIWRALETPLALAMIESGAASVSNPHEAIEDKGAPLLRLASFNGEVFYWKLISSIDAYRLRHYSEIASTLFDSTAVCHDYHYFQVIAHTADPAVFYVSNSDSGYSVDNLCPCSPACLAGEQSFTPAGLNLTWNRNTEADLDDYHVYKGLTEYFVPGSGNLVASTCDTMCFDGGWSWNGGYYYKVSAVDVHGNECGYALLRPEDITGAQTPKAPKASYLSQNYPNPFNPTTRIAFGLSEAAHVSLRIYDAAGRLVRMLVEGARVAGHYTEIWDGRDEAGRDVSSGVYFCRIEAGTFTQTRKMILLQ